MIEMFYEQTENEKAAFVHSDDFVFSTLILPHKIMILEVEEARVIG